MSVNGINGFNRRDVISVVAWLCTAFWAVNAETRAHGNQDLKELKDTITIINDKGTFASQSWERADTERQAAQDKRITADESRITADESQLSEIRPALARLEEQTEMIKNLLTEQSKRK